MSVTWTERERCRADWRRLTQAAIAAAANTHAAAQAHALARMARDAGRWVMPTPAIDEDQACVALMAVAKAFGTGLTMARRNEMASSLVAFAGIVGDILDRSEPPQPSRRPRADLDG